MRKDCRFWPEIHEVTRQGTLGRMRFVTPAKATRDYVSQQGWSFYEWDVDLTMDLLVGPFDLHSVDKIPDEIWKKLQKVAASKQVDISDINTVIPLR